MIDLFLATTDRDDGGLFVALAVLTWFVVSMYWAGVCGWVAREKDRHQGFWTCAGFVGWFLAFLPLAVVPDLTEYVSSDVVANAKAQARKRRDFGE